MKDRTRRIAADFAGNPINEFGIFRDGVLVSDGHLSKYSAQYELDHRTAPGGDWEAIDPSSFTVSKI
ncbi:hypothetical protein [Gordonia sp. GAMMA]|uniref:hypothetical protein n=1 Tax=Gordonia sp. GAMMA TaxID=2502241 RepID=UPI0010F61AF7|nr:hypothetical protein [Gordonia sp. GAMMA]